MRYPLLALLAAVLLPACSVIDSDPEPGRPPDGATVELVDGGEVTISSSVKTCSRDSDCTLVSTGCNGCCQQQAIHASYRDWYAEAFPVACAGYSGPVCDCIPAPVEARCVRQTCEAVVTR